MKHFDVKALGLEEMSAQEMKNSNGGFWWWLVGAAIGAAVYVYENWYELEQASQDAKEDYAADNQ